MADDFITDNYPGVTKDLIFSFNKSGKSQLSVMEVNGPEISKYGVVVPSKFGSEVSGLVEKPQFKDAPSNQVSIGRYVLTKDIFKILREIPTGAGGELQLADAINVLAKKRLVEIVKLRGKRFDCGSVDGYISATNHEYSKRTVL